jgi:hypothetical protein
MVKLEYPDLMDPNYFVAFLKCPQAKGSQQELIVVVLSVVREPWKKSSINLDPTNLVSLILTPKTSKS